MAALSNECFNIYECTYKKEMNKMINILEYVDICREDMSNNM